MHTLPTGTVLHRIAPYAYPADGFNPRASHRYYAGGRFESTEDDRYHYCYAATTLPAAIAERLLRDLDPDETGTVVLPRTSLDGLHACTAYTTRTLNLVDLMGLEGLSAVAQTAWLTTADPRDYAQTRHWAHWIRSQAPGADGFIWVSRREQAEHCVILFEDPKPTSPPKLAPGDPSTFTRLDDDKGREWLRCHLAPFHATVA
ncbi:RES family NAD+ phosphorylase [Cellulosimicrobium cellulans]|uniref:RES family NAD+ phosphorylase n=1 Tax=Cellulosimicrobium cellulans TaxID=1710 RepID=UPI001BA7EF3B|nr:RES family NAD+ phosphorylase [Cellulosimicrobium cellulans]QUC00621.1 RES family NAD+ phosphorylase [Cellulosimicrobium cellulans]